MSGKGARETYPTAQSLADDLTRFLRGEPISVRPSGPLERGYKWVKRNKVVSGAMTAVTLALLVGSGVSLGFGLYAYEQAEEARNKKQDAEEATKREEKEKQDAIAARNEVQKKSTELKRTLAKALFGPITVNNRNNPLGFRELEACWEIANIRGDAVASMFLTEATRTQLALGVLECRAEFTLHAAIGLDLKLRAEANELLLARLTAPQATAEERSSAAIICSRWDGSTDRTNSEAAKVFTHMIFDSSDWDVRQAAAQNLAVIALRLLPEQGTALILDLVARTNDRLVAGELLKLLPVIIHRLPPEQAVQLLTGAITKTKSAFALGGLAEVLGSVARHLQFPRAQNICSSVTPKLLERMRLFPKGQQGQQSEEHTRAALEKGFVALSTYIDTDVALRLFEELWDQAEFQSVRSLKYELLSGWVAVIVRLPPEQAIERLIPRTKETWNEENLYVLASGLARVSRNLSEKRADEVCTAFADRLISLIVNTQNSDRSLRQANAYAVLSPYVSPTILSKQCIFALNRIDNLDVQNALLEALIVFSQRFTERDAEAVAQFLAQDIVKSGGSRSTPAAALAAVSKRIPAERAVPRLINALTATKDPSTTAELAKGIAAVVIELRPERAAAICGPIAERLADELESTRDDFEYGRGTAFAAIVLFLPRERAAYETLRVSRLLVARMAKRDDRNMLSELAVVVRHLDAERAEGFSSQLMKAMVNTSRRPWHLDALATGAAAIAQQRTDDWTIELRTAFALRLLDEMACGSALTTTRDYSPTGFAAVVLGVSRNWEYSHYWRYEGAIQTIEIFTAPTNTWHTLSFLYPRMRPLPPQTLVELLKQPCCVGGMRRAVLDALEFTYSRKFKDQWEFVQFVQDNNILDPMTGKPLDLLTPPKRPQP